MCLAFSSMLSSCNSPAHSYNWIRITWPLGIFQKGSTIFQVLTLNCGVTTPVRDCWPDQLSGEVYLV